MNKVTGEKMNVFIRQSRTRKRRLIIRSAINLFIIFPALLSAQVDTVWMRKYNGPVASGDIARAFALDDAGNVYVTGASSGDYASDYGTIKYYPNGDTDWVRRYNGPGAPSDNPAGLAVDDSGNVYVTGVSGPWNGDKSYATVKYDASGVQQWEARYNASGNWDGATAIALDGGGNVYVTGYSDVYGTGRDCVTIKYNPAGDTVWVRRYNNGEWGSTDLASSIAVDNSGNVYVAGSSTGSIASTDYLLIKYRPNGDTMWVRFYNGPAGSEDSVFAIALDRRDSLCNVYVTGGSYNSSNNKDYATIKYDSAGVQQWEARYDGPAGLDDYASAIALDGSGNVYVTGTSSAVDSNADYATIKYYPNGDTAWVRRYHGPGVGKDKANAIAIDGAGNVYVTGGSCGSSNYRNYATIKYNAMGVQQWEARYDGPLSFGDDEVVAIAVDNSGYVYLTGTINISLSMQNADYMTIKYDQIGAVEENRPITFFSQWGHEIYPNPCRNSCAIHFNQPVHNATLHIYDAAGKLVKSFALNSSLSSNSSTLAISDLASGVYFVRVDNGSAVGKIIVTK